MIRLRATLTFAVLLVAAVLPLRAQTDPAIEGEVISGEGMYDQRSHLATFTNNVVIKYQGSVLSADSAIIHEDTGEVFADGNVRIQQDAMVWAGEHIHYNYRTHQIVSEHEFRTGKAPMFAEGQQLRGNNTNQVYYADHALMTADDVSEPAIKIRAKHIKIIPGKRLEATQAVLYLGDVPVFYFPYYSRNLGPRANNFNFTPGYRSVYGPFLLANYTWFFNEQFDGILHFDYREKRGLGGGPDINYHLGRWGDGSFRYYYTHDDDAETNATINAPVHENRQRIYYSYQSTPWTNLDVKALVRYQSDMGVLHDFFESEYRQDPQPDTFFEVNKFWKNFSLDVLAHPRVNDFFETVERLPDVRLSGFRQQIGESPLYYESESSAGYYRRSFAETNGFPPGLSYEAARADTYHQITIPETLFGWLNITPRAGGRFTYYSEAEGPGAATSQETREVFNTGAEVSFKASRLWPATRNELLDVDGLRHIVVPSVNYVYVPRPNDRPNSLPQFDYELPSLRLLPIEYPEYNSIDSIDSQNVLRFGLQNKLQTKRKGRVEDLLNWEVYTDWRLEPHTNQQTFADLYSDLTFRPRSWLMLQSQTRFNINNQNWNMLLHTLTIEPNNTWSWSIGQFYLRDDFSTSPTALGPGNSSISSRFYYRLNENWGLRAVHQYDVRGGRLQEQFYSIYRDLRSWTVAVTGGVRDNGTGPKDYTLTFTFSLKATPKFGLGSDTAHAASLLGH